MQLQQQLMLWILVLSLLIYNTNIICGTVKCRKDQYKINKNGTIISCLVCNSCPDGQGLYPPCGSVLEHPPADINCHSCEEGKTYSDEYGPSSCKKCHLCSQHEKVEKPCTVESNTICSGRCKSGMYFENATHNCQPCSYCCGNKNDIHIEACSSLVEKRCSIHNAYECTPTTTKTSVTETAKLNISTSTPERTKKNAVLIGVLSSIGGILFGIGVFALIYILKKKRKKKRGHRGQTQKPNNENGDLENGAGKPLIDMSKCSLDNALILLRIPNENCQNNRIELQCGSQLLLEVDGNENLNGCFNKCTFKWKNDGTELQQEEDNKLQKDNVELLDAGRYKCQLYCHQHRKNEDSCTIDVRIVPRPGEVLKLFCDINLVKRQKVENWLKAKLVPDVGNWQNVGEHYGMSTDSLNSIKDDDDRAVKVIDYLHASKPDLTVFDFCQFLKEINQNQIVRELSTDLIDSLNGTRDSGVDFVESQLQVDLPPIDANKLGSDLVKKKLGLGINPSYCESSRESSLDDLPTSVKAITKPKNDPNENKVSEPKKRKWSFNRQQSNHSDKSTGSGALNTIKNSLGNLRSQSVSSYAKHNGDYDTDDSEV